ncbi:Fragile X mental retardation syndrome-related protein 1-like B [Porphyridium purpureum]|uniref:Fragile X mental retardation syndrome-related protein 1-like B n=1 Tax=Porphyridium purpureum TaxID=35688 RepID=A0A5J4YUC5_PORPP|nr:Fragile X mental retardation syndrome-related protein 1-like B [Porphyridium purpureum]|eukprot:POR7781..scf229_5
MDLEWSGALTADADVRLEVLEPEERVYYEVDLLDVSSNEKTLLVRCLSPLGEAARAQWRSIKKDDGDCTSAGTSPQSLSRQASGGEESTDDSTDRKNYVTFEDDASKAESRSVDPDAPRAVWVPRSCVSFRKEPESHADYEARRLYQPRAGGDGSTVAGDAVLATETRFVFEPLEGDAVEVRCRETGTGPIGYREGYMNAIIDGFYHVTYPSGSDEMVELSRIRPAGFRIPADFCKQRVVVPDSVKQDVLDTSDTLVELKNSLGLAQIYLKKQVPSDQVVLELVGVRKAMANVAVAMDIHFQRVGSFARLTGLQRILNARLESAKIQRETACTLVFEVSSDMIGSCIGKNGTNLKAAQRIPGVIRIRVDDDLPRAIHRVEILATSNEAAEKARDMIDHVRVQIAVDADEIGLLIGKKGVHLREIEQRAGVSKFVLVDPPHAVGRDENPSIVSEDEPQLSSNKRPPQFLETVGPRKQVALAVQLFNMHRSYLSKQREMEENVRKLRERLALVGIHTIAEDAGAPIS